MAKVKITGHASGTGVITITAPNTSTDRTITLPDGTGTLLDENSSLPAANLTGTIASARLPTSTDLPLAGGTMTGTVAFADNVYATFGTSADLRIKHNGAESVIQDQGSGALYMASNEFKVTNAAITENMIIATENAAVKLFYDNAQKFITTSTGIDVTGGVTASTTIKCGTAEASSGVASDTFAFMGVNTSNNATKHGAVFSSKHADSNILLCGIQATAFNALVAQGMWHTWVLVSSGLYQLECCMLAVLDLMLQLVVNSTWGAIAHLDTPEQRIRYYCRWRFNN